MITTAFPVIPAVLQLFLPEGIPVSDSAGMKPCLMDGLFNFKLRPRFGGNLSSSALGDLSGRL